MLDTGVDETADLAGNLVPGASMLDADGTADGNGHGTAMASIVAAQANNGAGIAGVGYRGVSVMPVKVLGADGTGQDSDVVEGVVYAADHGADVILMAFSNPGRSEALQAAADYAWSKGAVLVASTGNDGSTSCDLPGRPVQGRRRLRDHPGRHPVERLELRRRGVPRRPRRRHRLRLGHPSPAPRPPRPSRPAPLRSSKANDSSASNGVVVGRLARTADPAGSASDTGNGRVNLARALGDSSTDAVVPQGVAGDGGPLVGPYTADAFKVDLQAQSNPPCS